MANFTYSSWAAWSDDGAYLYYGNDDGTITDVDDDDQFESGDAGGKEPRIGIDNLTYIGTIDFGGTLYPVFQDDDFGDYWIFAQADDELPTSDFDPNIINTGAVFSFCFAAGTRIATPGGGTIVEDLQIGDPILTADGRTVPVKWVGRQTIFTLFRPAERLMPVRFAAGSLGAGLPRSDLTVTADHGMLVYGVICHAGALVNGETITRVPLSEMAESYTVYHIETEEHEIILANGAPAETFIDNVSRRVFDNYAEFEALYGDVPEMEELPHPRAMSARQVPERIRTMLARVTAA